MRTDGFIVLMLIVTKNTTLKYHNSFRAKSKRSAGVIINRLENNEMAYKTLKALGITEVEGLCGISIFKNR